MKPDTIDKPTSIEQRVGAIEDKVDTVLALLQQRNDLETKVDSIHEEVKGTTKM
jgi:hypothetical protein